MACDRHSNVEGLKWLIRSPPPISVHWLAKSDNNKSMEHVQSNLENVGRWYCIHLSLVKRHTKLMLNKETGEGKFMNPPHDF